LARGIEKIIDFRDSLSTISLLKVTQVFSNMDHSEILEIRGVDADIQQDLFKVLPQEAYEIMKIEDNADASGLKWICIRKIG
jgi:TusA-related sulfurtransferase